MNGNIFRPSKLEDLIGCNNIKQTIRVALDASVARNDAFPHTLLYGGPGLGKTTISNIIAKERGGDFKIYLADVFRSREDVRNLMAQLNFDGHEDDPNQVEGETPKFVLTGPIKPTVVFLDEIHKLRRDTQEAFFQAMEDNLFTLDSEDRMSGRRSKQLTWVPKFTLIGATTRAGDLDTAFIERFKLTLTLQLYTLEEIILIVKAHAAKYKLNITHDAVLSVAQRSRGIPRKAVNYLERARDMALYSASDVINKAIVEKSFEILQVDETGLEPLDAEVLRYLYSVYPRKVGVARLAGILNITENVLKEVVEPYLLRQGLIEATPSGRTITELGMVYCDKHGLVRKDKKSPTKLTRRITDV